MIVQSAKTALTFDKLNLRDKAAKDIDPESSPTCPDKVIEGQRFSTSAFDQSGHRIWTPCHPSSAFPEWGAMWWVMLYCVSGRGEGSIPVPLPPPLDFRKPYREPRNLREFRGFYRRFRPGEFGEAASVLSIGAGECIFLHGLRTAVRSLVLWPPFRG